MTLSLGCTLIINSFLTLSPLKMSPGTSLYWILTSAFLSFKALPHFKMKGTPSHLSLLILRTAEAKVGHVEPSGTVGSWRYPRRPSSSGWSGLPSYCPRTTSLNESWHSFQDLHLLIPDVIWAGGHR